MDSFDFLGNEDNLIHQRFSRTSFSDVPEGGRTFVITGYFIARMEGEGHRSKHCIHSIDNIKVV